MHDGVTARDPARRHARRLHAMRAGGTRVASGCRRIARVLMGAALVAAAQCPLHVFDVIAPAHAAGAAANTPVQAAQANQVGRPAVPVPRDSSQPRATLPGFNPPPSYASGTTASGPVRAQPARMPFYVATRGKTTLYLLGTLHVGDPNDYPPAQPFRAPILGALAASPTLALELSPDDLLVSQDDVSKYGVCSYQCLPKQLPEPLWHKLETRLRSNPAALEEIRKMRPWLAALLVETYDSLSAGLQTEYGTEAQLQNVYLRQKEIGRAHV